MQSSTDGTTEFFADLRLPNLHLVSEPDTGLGDALQPRVRSVQRRDQSALSIRTICMLPNALDTVDRLFRRHRRAVAIYSAVQVIDADGEPLRLFVPAEFDQRALMRCELVPPMSTTYFDRRRCGADLRGDASLTAGQDYELLLRLSNRRILRTTAVLGATRISSKSMTRDAANYERFCREKIAALEGFIRARPPLESERDSAVAGIYCWTAESILEIEGPGPRYESFVDRAAEIEPASERLRLLRDKEQEMVEARQ